MKINFVLLLILSIACSALISQNAPPLQNFANPALFNLKDSSCTNLSGEWAGEETEFTSDNGIKGKYAAKFNLTQQGNYVTGNSFISFGNGDSYGNMKIRGMVLGNKLYFEEYEIVDQKFAQPGILWCLRTGELSISESGGSINLQGSNYKGYAAYYYFDCVGHVEMKLEKAIKHQKEAVQTKKTISEKTCEMKLFPNPAVNEVTIAFTINEELPVRVDMYSLSGELITNFIDDSFKAGTHQRNISLKDWAAGVYMIRMLAGKNAAAGMLVISR